MEQRGKRQIQGQWDELVRRTTALIPSVTSILEQALQTLQLDAKFINSQFGEALRQVDETATKIYFEHERKVLEFAAQNWLEQNCDRITHELPKLLSLLHKQGWEAFKQRVMPIFVDFAELVQKLEKHLGNMRKARGGQTFELAVVYLLRVIGISCEKPTGGTQQQLKRIDLVVPDIQTALEQTRTNCLPNTQTNPAGKMEARGAWSTRTKLLAVNT